MSAYITVDLKPLDVEKLKQYSAAAGPIVEAFGGKFIARGPGEALHGEIAFPTKVIIEFPDREAAQNWYNSTEYQALIQLRDEGMESQFHLVG